MGEHAERYPLFPLGLVLLPGEVVPLHIFEERYRLMIGECLEGESDFGIVWLAEGGLRETGCGAHVTQVLDRLDGGRMNILVAGTRPFRLLRRIEDLPYPAGTVEFLDETPGVDSELVETTRERYADLVERVTDERPDAAELAELDAYGMAATIEFAPSAKQELLELRSEDARLRRIGELFVTTVRRLEASERAGKLARSNGRIHIRGI